jgi:hypothetical protein
MNLRARILSMLGVVVALGVGLTAVAAAPTSPDAVKNALRILAYVQDDMARKLPAHAYNRLPHESQEFEEASAALRDAVAGDPAELRAKVESALGKALAASRSVAEISKGNDEARITAAVKAVDTELRQLSALFPAALRPVPGQLDAQGPSGPPPGLR